MLGVKAVADPRAGMSIVDPQGTADHRLRTAAQNLKLNDTFQKALFSKKSMNHQQLFIKPDHIVAGHNLLFTNGVSKVEKDKPNLKLGQKFKNTLGCPLIEILATEIFYLPTINNSYNT